MITGKAVPGPSRRLVLVPSVAGAATAQPADTATSAAAASALRATVQVNLVITSSTTRPRDGTASAYRNPTAIGSPAGGPACRFRAPVDVDRVGVAAAAAAGVLVIRAGD